jgi:hypothetical protein
MAQWPRIMAAGSYPPITGASLSPRHHQGDFADPLPTQFTLGYDRFPVHAPVPAVRRGSPVPAPAVVARG